MRLLRRSTFHHTSSPAGLHCGATWVAAAVACAAVAPGLLPAVGLPPSAHAPSVTSGPARLPWLRPAAGRGGIDGLRSGPERTMQGMQA